MAYMFAGSCRSMVILWRQATMKYLADVKRAAGICTRALTAGRRNHVARAVSAWIGGKLRELRDRASGAAFDRHSTRIQYVFYTYLTPAFDRVRLMAKRWIRGEAKDCVGAWKKAVQHYHATLQTMRGRMYTWLNNAGVSTSF